MSKTSLLHSCEATINAAIKRISELDGHNKKALEDEFREWINAIDSDESNYDVLYINKTKVPTIFTFSIVVSSKINSLILN